MAINAGSVVAFMELDTSRFTSGLSSAGEQMKQFMNSNNSMESRIQSLGSSMQTVGKTATVGVTLPLVGIGTAAVKTSMDFEAQMSKVKAISGATGEDFNKLRDQAIQLGADTNFSASEAAGGMENLASAGFKVSDIMSAMPGMLSLAAAGDVDIATASDIASSALNGFGMSADKTTHVADVLAKVAGDTNAAVTDTGEAMKYIAPVANSLGVSFEDTATAIGLLSNAGIKGSQAGTTLRSALTSLASPTDAATKTMKQLGMNFFDASGKMLPLGQIIQILQDKTKGLTQQQKASVMETLFGKEAMSGMLALVSQGPQKFDELSKGLKKCDGASKEMADTMQDNLKGSIEAMKGSIETLGIKLGDALAPTVKIVANGIAKLANAFSGLPKPMQTVIANAFLAAAAFGPVMMIMGKMISSTSLVVSTFKNVGSAITSIGRLGNAVKSLGSIFGGLGKASSIFTKLPAIISPPVLIAVGIIAGLGFVVYEVIKHWNGFVTFFQGVGTKIKNVFSSVTDFAKKSGEGWILIFQQVGSFLSKSAQGWKAIFVEVGGVVTKCLEGWAALGNHIMDGLMNGLKAGKDKVVNFVGGIGESIKDKFKSIMGIHSPSTVFHDFGIFTGQGLLNGLVSMESALAKQAIKYSEIIKPKLPQVSIPKVALSGIGGSINTKSLMSKLRDSVLNFNPKITLYVTVADTGEKGTKKLAGEVKDMTGNALKDAMSQLFMNDVLRD